MAVRIDRVEREFILGTAAESKTEARLRAAGRSIPCRLSASGGEGVAFSVESGDPAFSPRELVSVCFDFRGQSVAFDAPVIKAGAGKVELGIPETMYRSLSRRWPRVRAPKGFTVDILLPDEQLRLDCPESEEWSDVELPELREGLDSRSLATLVESFKSKASLMASEGRVVMYKDKGPSDIAEEMAARLGRVLYVPSTNAGLPIADPYPSGRIVTREMAEDFEGAPVVAQGTKLASYLRARAAEGLNSALWCPVVYYRYSVGVVLMMNDRDRPRSLDFGAVDLAWEFSRILAWFLKRHGYFADSATGEVAPRMGGLIDASPAGLLMALPSGGPKIDQGAIIRLRLGLGADKTICCSGKVARKYQEGGMNFFGLAFMDFSAEDRAVLSLELYGETEEFPGGGA